MPEVKTPTGTRKTAGIRRGRAKGKPDRQSSLRPNTQVSVAEGFNNVLVKKQKSNILGVDLTHAH